MQTLAKQQDKISENTFSNENVVPKKINESSASFGTIENILFIYVTKKFVRSMQLVLSM